MKTIIETFKKNNGYARMQELRQSGIQTREIAKAIAEGTIEKIKPGMYKLVSYSWDEHSSFADVCQANKKSVICLLSAASYYELTTFTPSEIYVAVPSNTDTFLLEYPPVHVYYFIKKYYEPGIDILNTKSGVVRMYNTEKTIGDLFRYINKVGEDIALESLKTYLQQRKRNISKLMRYAELCGVRKKIEPILKGMLH